MSQCERHVKRAVAWGLFLWYRSISCSWLQNCRLCLTLCADRPRTERRSHAGSITSSREEPGGGPWPCHETQHSIRCPPSSEERTYAEPHHTADCTHATGQGEVLFWLLLIPVPVQEVPCQHRDLNVDTAGCLLYSGSGKGAQMPGTWSLRQLNFVLSCVIFFSLIVAAFLLRTKMYRIFLNLIRTRI
jgi:hypothetical protein